MQAADIERVRWPSIAMAASHLMGEATMRRSILESLCAHPLLRPDAYGTDGRRLDPFDFESAATHGTAPYPNSTAFHVRRRKAIKYEALIFQSSRAGIDVEFHPATTPTHWPDVFELGDAIARAVRPDFGTVHLLSEASDLFPTSDPDVVTRRMMDAGTSTAPAGYFADGAGGLGLRTYLGPLAVAQLGRDRIRTLPAPAVVTELDWGGLRVDLTAEPWRQLGPTTRSSWRQCMAHLAPAGWFSTMTVHQDGQVTLTPPDTPGWNPGGHVPKPTDGRPW